ncbi:MAG: tail fiber domain-containing protein [Bacteroidota bacterium]
MKEKFLPLLVFLFATIHAAAQNVGIGLLSPFRGKLEVQGTGNTVAIFGGDNKGLSIQRSNPAIGFNQYYDGSTSRYIGTGYAAVQWLNPATGEMFFDMFGSGSAGAPYTTITRAITISRTGNVGIGTTPLINTRVTVARGTGSYGTAMFRGSTYASHINYNINEDTYIRGGKDGSYVYLNDILKGEVLMGNPVASDLSLVKVGINNPNTNHALEVRQASGRGLIMINTGNFGNWHFKVGPHVTALAGAHQYIYFNESPNPAGSWHPGSAAYYALSDERVKTDIKPMAEISGQLQKLQPVQYQMDLPQAGQDVHSGFIAQDVLQVFPDLVTHQKDSIPGATIPDMHLLNYDGLAVYAIRLIQEQQQKIEVLKKRLETLKKATKNHPLP